MSISFSGISEKNINKDNIIFKSDFKKYTINSSEFKKIDLSKVFNYEQDIDININLLGDLLHRCYLTIELPVLNLTDSLINDIKYTTFKNNKLNNLQNKINYWKEEYDNIYNFTNIQIIVYSNIKNLFKLKNITLEYIILQVNTLVNDFSEDLNNFKLLIDADIIEYIDIVSYLNNLTSLNVSEVSSEIDEKYNFIKNYLNYYHSNKIYYENKYKDVVKGNIFYKWIDNLSHHYFTNFEFYLDGQLMDYYSNDMLNIYQTHNVTRYLKDNYDKLIGNSDHIYNNKNTKNYIYTPLLFWFCKDISNSLPLVGLMNSSMKISTRINKLKNLIYFQDWRQYYEDILNIEIPREDII